MNLKFLCVLGLVFALSSQSYARFGGSRSGGSSSSRSYSSPSRSYSSPSRSYTFGGSRSSGQPATIIRKPAPSYSGGSSSGGNTIVHNTTVVQQSGGGSGIWPWLFFWEASRQPQQPVIINNVPQGQAAMDPNQPQQPVQVLVQQPAPQQSSHWFLWLVLIVVILGGVSYWLLSEKEED